jgi:hypothetical protein
MSLAACRRASQSGISLTTLARLARIVSVAFLRFRRSCEFLSETFAASENSGAVADQPTRTVIV